MASIDHLLVLADAYGAATGRSRARVATLVFNDGKGLDRIAGGADIGVRRCVTAISWFSTHWPPDTPWPADVPRPAPAPAGAGSPSGAGDAPSPPAPDGPGFDDAGDAEAAA